jgi:hypothetical protein
MRVQPLVSPRENEIKAKNVKDTKVRRWTKEMSEGLQKRLEL